MPADELLQDENVEGQARRCCDEQVLWTFTLPMHVDAAQSGAQLPQQIGSKGIDFAGERMYLKREPRLLRKQETGVRHGALALVTRLPA